MDWQLRLTDAMSGPAARAAAALKPVEDKLRAVNQQLASSAIDKMNDGLRKQQAQLRQQRAELGANLKSAKEQERAEAQMNRAAERAKAAAAREEYTRQRAAESQARIAARAKASADRALERSAQDRARVQEGVRRREVAALAASARAEQAQQRASNRAVERQNRARVRAENQAQKEIARVTQADEKAKAKAASDAARALAEADQRQEAGSARASMLVAGQVGMLLKVAAAALAAAAAVLALGAAFTRAVIDAVAFREAALGGLTQVVKNAASARQVYNVGIQLSARWNIDPRETVTQLQDLISKGFSATEARVLLTASADLKVMNPNANIAGIMLAIGQIRSKGVLQMEELQGQLAEAGINVGKTLEIIGKKTGRTAAQVRKDISAGKVDSNTGIWAIVKSIEEMGGGKLGSVADKASKSISSMIAGLQFRPGLIALKIAEMIEGGAGEGALKGALARLLAATDPEKSPGMKRLLAGASNLANELLQMLFGPLASAGGKNGLQYILDRAAVGIELVAAGVRSVRPMVTGFLTGFGQGASLVIDVLLALGKSLGFGKDLSSAADAARLFGKALAILLGVAVVIAAAIVAASAQTMAFVQLLASAPAIVASAASSIMASILALPGVLMAAGVAMGTNLWSGFVEGINAGIAAVSDAGSRLANAARSAVGDALRIRSPSRVMMEMGSYTAQGFRQGVEGGQAQVDTAMTELVKPSPAALGQAPKTSVQASKGNVTIINNIYTQSDAPADVAAAAEKGAMAGLSKWFEDALTQTGLSPEPTPGT